MESLTSAISVQVDSSNKEVTNSILKDLGLNMSTFVNMAIKQLIYTDGLPFSVRKSSKELKESDEIIEEIRVGKRQGYSNMKDLIKSLEGY